jgi:hemerythrin-like domain-containing protein
MQARGPLMVEHRLIERMIGVIKTHVDRFERTGSLDPSFVDTAVDFIRTYADRTHHGKEEDILFHKLEGRPLSEADRSAMADLVQDHRQGRLATKGLVDATRRYRDGDRDALSDIISRLTWLADFYPHHIAKEDKSFFPAARAYFTDDEDQEMLAQFWEFDRKMIHERYRAVVDTLVGAQPDTESIGPLDS